MELREELARLLCKLEFGGDGGYFDALPEGGRVKYYSRTVSITALFRQEVEGIENPYSEAWDYFEYKACERFRHAVLEQLGKEGE